MIRLTALFAIAAATACCAAAQAKVGIVNMQQALLQTAEIKKAQADLTAKFRPRQLEIEQLNSQIQTLQQQLQQGKLNAMGEQQVRSEGQLKQRQMQRMDQDLREDVDRERTDTLTRAGQRMTEVVRNLAQEKNLDVVIDAASTITFKPSLDITSDAVAAYDAKYPAK
jgi:outer membrane protein